MGIDFETAIEMQRICTGETRELSRGQIAGEVIDIDSMVKGFNQEKADKCKSFYEEILKDTEKKPYDADMLIEETEAIKKQMENFLSENSDDGSFQAIFDGISEFFMNPPFEGLDGIEYGVNEVCVFSVLEYMLWKTGEEHDHFKVRKDYRDNIAARTYEEVGDHWIGVYDNLQKRYEAMGLGIVSDLELMENIAACSIVAISAIKDQDDFTLDMAQFGAVEKGKAIAAEYMDDKYEEGDSIFTDNVVRLVEFIWGYLKG